MKQDREFVAHLGEVFRSFGEVHAKSMFGGYGLYHHGLMIGLVADDTLYLKVDGETIPDFSKAGSVPFQYVKNGTAIKMSFFSAPPEIFDDARWAKQWADKAYTAALRSRQRSGTRGKSQLTNR